MMPDNTSPAILRVFLCHSSGDKPAVRELYRKLKLDGFDPWLDKEKLLPGQKWEREITRAVRESDIVVACLSNASITKAGYVQKELKFALDVAEEQPEGNIFIIPAKLEECDIPERLSGLHWVNLFEPDGYERLVRALKHRVQTLDTPSGSPQKRNPKSLLDSRASGSTDTPPTRNFEQHRVELEPDERLSETPRDLLAPAPIQKRKLKSLLNNPLIVVALSIALVVIVTGYWQFKKSQATGDQVQYTATVMNAVNLKPVANAKITVETKGTPQVYYSDSKGVFNLKLPKRFDSARMEVAAEGFELFDRNISVSTTWVDYVLLIPKPVASPTVTPTPSPSEKDEQVPTSTQRRQHTKVPCSAADRLLGRC